MDLAKNIVSGGGRGGFGVKSCPILLLLALVVSGNKGSEIRDLNGRSQSNGHAAPLALTASSLSSAASPSSLHPQIQSHGNVTVLVGQRGELKCLVTNLGNYSLAIIMKKIDHPWIYRDEGDTSDEEGLSRADYESYYVWVPEDRCYYCRPPGPYPLDTNRYQPVPMDGRSNFVREDSLLYLEFVEWVQSSEFMSRYSEPSLEGSQNFGSTERNTTSGSNAGCTVIPLMTVLLKAPFQPVIYVAKKIIFALKNI